MAVSVGERGKTEGLRVEVDSQSDALNLTTVRKRSQSDLLNLTTRE